MTAPLYTELKGLSFLFKGNPFNKAISSLSIETKGLQVLFQGNPFVINQDASLGVSFNFQSTPLFEVLLEVDLVLEFTGSISFALSEFKFEFVLDLNFEIIPALEVFYDLIIYELEFNNNLSLICDFFIFSSVVDTLLDLEFSSIGQIQFDIDERFSRIASFLFDSVGELITSVDLLIPYWYDEIFENGLELELDLNFLTNLYEEFVFDFVISNTITSLVELDFEIENRVLLTNEVEKNIGFFNRVSPTQSYEYSRFYLSKTHGV